MGNSLSTLEIPQDAPASPNILFSISIMPSTITFPVRQPSSAPKLAITLTNTTSRHITFRHARTPLDLSNCFTYGEWIQTWSIINLTEDCAINVITANPPCRYDVEPSDPTTIHHDFRVFTTVPPAPDSVKLEFDINIRDGFTAGHTYAFRLKDFEVPAAWWGYGNKNEVVGRRNRNGGWQTNSEDKRPAREGGKASLLFRGANPEGAVVKTEWKVDEVGDGEKSAWKWIAETIGGNA